jgi:hypothetical protein
MTRGTKPLGAALVWLAAASTVSAQTYHGGLRGGVRDPGGVVPGAEVSLTNEATSQSRATTTNSAGEYAFVNVEPGTYTVRVAMRGFKTLESRGVRVGTQQFLTLDFTLEIGELQEAVTVEGLAPLLETSNASVGSTLDEKTLQVLPTAGRNAFFLAVTTPNVIPSGDPQFVRQQDQTNSSLLSLAGGPRRGNNYTIDGVSIVDLRNRATFIPSLEAVEEVKVQVSTYDAEMGRTGGGVFNTTGKSGGNDWRAGLVYQNRPSQAASLLYFQQRQCDQDPSRCAKPDTFFHLYGGSIGGPIVKNKTFFWATTEGYRTKTPRNANVVLPTDRELSGDFSQSGVTIYDPLNVVNGQRQQFPGNVIPANRINPVAQRLRQYWPTGGSGSRTAELKDKADTATLKLDQRWSEKVYSSAMYAYYDSEEPEARLYGIKRSGENPADPSDGALFRTVHMLAVNNTLTPDPSTAAHVRFGFTTFKDDDIPLEFDVASLGFAPAFAGLVRYPKFPQFIIGTYGDPNRARVFGDRDPQDTKYYSWEANASVSRLLGRHTVKVGASYRKIGAQLLAYGNPSGEFTFNGVFTAQNENAARGNAHALADFLLGYPSSGTFTVATPNDFFIDYYAAFVQDDFRVSSKLTINYGLRYEFEQGLREKNDAFTVGFDRDRAWPFQVPGLNLRGGLMYAGVDGYPTHQSDPSKTKFSPRIGFAWSPTTELVVRGGYGLFWAPYQYPFPTESSFGTRGFTAVTDYVASTDSNRTPANSIVNPFPQGVQQPLGASSGILTGAGGSVNFVDQLRQSPRVHQFSLDVQRELPGDIALSVGYLGARGEKLGISGTNATTININQIDPRLQSLGAALQEQVPNPMFGDSRFGQFGRQRTIARGQLLRPYPQFGDLLAHQVSAGKSRYHSLVLRVERRIRNGWGARVNYTWSNAKDNLVGETNFFSSRSATPLDNYDLEAEFGTSLLDTPHRLNITATAELPFGKGKRWLSEPGLARVLLGGWAITVVGSYQSGFPVNISQNPNNSNLLGSGQRPNLTGADPKTPGGTDARVDGWFNRAAWSLAPAFTYGNAPRIDTRVRTPMKKNTDIALQKIEPLGGRRTLMVRFEIINAFNDANLQSPDTVFGSSTFGRITQVGGFPRMLQLTFRFGF